MDQKWQEDQRKNLIEFGALGFDEQLGGFGRLQADGAVLRERGLETWANCRAVYCFALDVLAGNDSSRDLVDKGARCLLGPLMDGDYSGWFTGVSESGEPYNDGRKEAYTHAFVLLAASSLKAVSSPFAEELFSKIDEVLADHFWSEEESATVESWNRDWSAPEAYRGANSNMHTTEASLAAFDVTHDQKWLDRADKIASRIIGDFARSNSWRIPEHFDANWVPDFDYNIDEPNHPFRPYGATPGHGFEWARLILQLSDGLRRAGRDVPAWHSEAAVGLFDQAAKDGWQRNGHPGFCYTVTFSGEVVTDLHLAWVACEALSAAIVMDKVLDGDAYRNWIATLWAYCDEFLVDRELGGWRTELSSSNLPSATIWGDKPDFYHPLQTVLIPRAKVGPSLLGAFAT